MLKKISNILNNAVKKYDTDIIGSYADKLLLKYAKNIIEVPYLEWYNSSVSFPMKKSCQCATINIESLYCSFIFWLKKVRRSRTNYRVVNFKKNEIFFPFNWKKCDIVALIIEKSTLKVDEKIVARKFKIIMEMEAKNDKLLWKN